MAGSSSKHPDSAERGEQPGLAGAAALPLCFARAGRSPGPGSGRFCLFNPAKRRKNTVCRRLLRRRRREEGLDERWPSRGVQEQLSPAQAACLVWKGASPGKFVWQFPFLSATVKRVGRDESREGCVLVSYPDGMLSITASAALHQRVLVLCLPAAPEAVPAVQHARPTASTCKKTNRDFE